VVSSVVNFGAFVDLGGMDGLVHVSELSWKHVDHPSSVVSVGDEIPPSPKYDVIIESVGGRTLGTALAALERGGVCVTLGVSASAEVTFDTRAFFATGRTTLYGFYIFTELGSEPASVGLRRLAELVAAGQLAPHVSLERPWSEIAQVAQDLMARRFPGKAVLTLE